MTRRPRAAPPPAALRLGPRAALLGATLAGGLPTLTACSLLVDLSSYDKGPLPSSAGAGGASPAAGGAGAAASNAGTAGAPGITTTTWCKGDDSDTARCYTYLSNEANWAGQLDACKSLGDDASLVELSSYDEEQHLGALLSAKGTMTAWVDLFCPAMDASCAQRGAWRWSNSNSGVEDDLWGTTEPDDTKPGGPVFSCGRIWQSGNSPIFFLEDVGAPSHGCDAMYAAVCQSRPGP